MELAYCPGNLPSLPGQHRINFFQFNPKAWQFINYYIPDKLKIGTKILMNKTVSHSLNQYPWHMGVGFFYIIRQPCHRFANYLDIIKAGFYCHEI